MDAPEGYFVIERRPDPPQGPTRIGAKHILFSYAGAEHAIKGVTRSESEARSGRADCPRCEGGGRDWNALAAKYTDEPGSKRRAAISASSAVARWSRPSRTRPSRCRSVNQRRVQSPSASRHPALRIAAARARAS